ncbi:restriction endonuclease subunit S [Leyella stercorea]|uniref:restriction endonuclease subunit S n=1 Tax=Leyella stercorea TaxID=363265 RepID=UPI00242AEB23|nr:restriction endonuclease subunit S [Leyella stercorea]
MESEFYNSNTVSYKNTVKASQIIDFSQYGTSKELNEMGEGYPVLRLNEFNYSFISHPDKYCSLLDIDAYHGLQLKKDDVLICRTNGNPKFVGRSAIVPKDYDYAFASYLFRIRPNRKYINSATLVAFLNSKYGRLEIEKYSMVGNQANFSPAKFREISIPVFSKDLNDKIEDITYRAFQKLEMSESLYSEAANNMLECLDLNDFTASSNSCNVKTLKESFIETGRLDAEYYQPKYDDILHHIQAYKYGSKNLAEICDIKEENFTPKDDTTYKYVELANIGKYGNIIGCSQQKGEDLPSRARRIVSKNDVVISSLEGSLDSCALVEEDYDGALCSTGFYVLKSSVLNSETLLVLFKSPLVKELMRKGCSGTILTAIGRQELERIPIPLIRQEIQDEIAQHVQSSISLRKESQQLLEYAKLTVEGAIQNGGGKIASDYYVLQEKSAMELHIAIYVLLHEVGIISNDAKVKVSNVVCSCKKLSDSFLASGRLDAEYYQPKYDLLFEKLKGFPTATIKEIATIQKSIEPGSDAYQEEGIPFIRVANLSKFGLSNSDVKLDTTQFADTIRPQKDTILLSKDGSVGIAYKMEETQDVITSSAILHLQLTTPNVLPDYLTLVLNSIVVKLQAERDAGGSIIQHWKPSEIEHVIIPILPMNEQQMITNKIKQSFKMREDAQDLLLQAKCIIETAIEK